MGRYLPTKMPAVGFSFSLEALEGLCSEQLSNLKIDSSPKVLVLSINQDDEAIKLSRVLRKAKVSTTMLSGKPSKALEYANSLGIPYVIFLGNEEVSQKKFKLKDMKSGDEKLLTEAQLIKKLGKY